MSSVALTLVLAAAVQEGTTRVAPPPSNEVVARIGNTPLHARLEIPGFTQDQRAAKALQQALGGRGILVGAIPDRSAMVVLIVDKENEKRLDDLEWRDANLKGSGTEWKYFESHGMPCGEASILVDGSGSHDFHAFAVRAGYRFDLNLSESLERSKPGNLGRAQFEELVDTFRLGLVRLGTWNQMPAVVMDRMDAALRQGGRWDAYLAELARSNREDYTIPFARAEMLRFHRTGLGEQPAEYARAAKLLAAERDMDARERLAYAACEHGHGLALLDGGNGLESLEHFQAALKIARDLTAPARAEIGYDLARAHARLGHVVPAVDRLLEAEAQHPGALGRARMDPDFDEVRPTKAFSELFQGKR